MALVRMEPAQSDDSAFSLALREFINQPTKKRTPRFIQKVLKGGRTTLHDVNQELQAWERENSQRVSQRVLRPVFQAISDYDGIISVLCQADPYPSALIWGGLKAVIECFRRYNEVFKLIEGHLGSLTQQLKMLKQYEELFSQSNDMMELLISSYKCILRFWTRVEDQCTASGFVLAVKSLTSFSTRKIEEIIAELTDNRENMAKLVPVIQERLRRKDNEDAAQERFQAGVTLNEILNRLSEQREQARREMVESWITGSEGMSLNESNFRRQYQRQRERLGGTGTWLYNDQHFCHWMDPDSGSNILWLRGGPGVGKSIICSHAIEELETLRQEAVVAFHFFSFDEEEQKEQIYRNLAGQLFFALYSETEEISERILGITRHAQTVRTLQEMIRALIAETAATFVFLDGLDEECSKKGRWDGAGDILAFLAGCAKENDSALKLWCSSQDHRYMRDSLAGSEEIQLSAATNSKDISKYLESAFASKDFDELHENIKTTIMKDLKKQVNGNFLWLSLMLDTIREATDIPSIKEIVRKGFPDNFEKYLERKIQGFPADKHKPISKVLSCIVYAKRPLFLDELCEAIEIFDEERGINLESDRKVLRRQLLDSCAPLVRVEEVRSSATPKQVCSLSHASVRTFLQNNPNILSDNGTCGISNSVLAVSCLKYLQQPRYGGLLTTKDRTFVTKCGESITAHALLTYAAKYWHKHLDPLPYQEELGKIVKEFARSANFATCLQVQSLFVGGQFDFWYSASDTQHRTRLVRPFPKWFVPQHPGGAELQQQYNSAIGEWSHYLSERSTYRGEFRGQIDHCLWSSLGKGNFLHGINSRVKNFLFENPDAARPAKSTLFFDRVGLDGTEVDIFQVVKSDAKSPETIVNIERWNLARGRSPKMKRTQTLSLPPEAIRPYEVDLKEPIPERAPILSSTRDGKLLRIGSQLYSGCSGRDLSYRQIELEGPWSGYCEELASNGRFFVLASRNQVSHESVKEEIGVEEVKGDAANLKVLGESSSNSDTDSSDSNDTESDESERDGEDEVDIGEKGVHGKRETQDAAKETPSEADSLDLRSNFSEDDAVDALDWSETNESLSARESYSEGSTDTLSADLEDERDWDDDDELEVFDEGFAESSTSSKSDAQEKVEDSISSASSSANALDITGDNSFESFLDDAVRSAPSWMQEPGHLQSNRGSSTSSSGDSEQELIARRQLQELLEGALQRGRQGPRTLCEIQVHKFARNEEDVCERVFRFHHRVSGKLYESPPVLHQREDLLVWPLGGASVLFANFTEGTFFTRQISKSHPTSCFISVQCNFSACGYYLHMASLEAMKMRFSDGEMRLGLKLVVSTHRLSKRKLARSPPRLIFRTSVQLDKDFSEGEKLEAKNLPISLTWTEEYLYVSETGQKLRVHRLPLWQAVENRDESALIPRGVVYNRGNVFLPKSALARKVHFFLSTGDSSEGSSAKKAKNGKSSSKTKDKYIAHVLLSSLNEGGKPGWIKGAPGEVFYERTATQGLHLTEEQLGDWDSGHGPCLRPTDRSETWRAGELMTRFEEFDTSEDCDIVPYLHY